MRHTLIALSLLATYGTVLAADAPAPAAAPTPAAAAQTTAVSAAPAVQAMSLTGTWTSHSFGKVLLEQNGNKITGSLQYHEEGVTYDYKIEGTLTDKKVTAKYHARAKGSEEESRGELEWKLSDDGKTLTGWYLEEGSQNKEDFNLNR